MASDKVLTPIKITNTNDTNYGWTDRKVIGADGGILEIIIDGKTYSTTISETGFWSFTPPEGWVEGAHTVQLVSIDKATNRSAPNTTIINIDKTPPAQPEIWRVVDKTGTDKGNLTPGDTSDELKPAISGVAEPGSMVYLFDNDGATAIASVQANNMGGWTFTPDLTDGAHSLTVMSEDATKNASIKSAPFNLIINSGVVVFAEPGVSEASVAPVANVDSSSIYAGEGPGFGFTTPTYLNRNIINPKGTAEAGSKVQVVINNVDYYATADSTGKWSLPAIELPNGTYVLQTRSVDRAGNWGDGKQQILIIDSSMPDAPQIMRVIDDVGAMDYMTSNQYTNDKTPTISGIAQPGSLVTIFGTDSMPIGSVMASNDGRWTFEPTLGADGTYVFNVSYVDRFGNTSSKSDNFALNLDTSVPGLPTLEEVYDDFGRSKSALKSGDITDDKTPTLSGTADAGTIINIWDGDKIIASTVADSRGKWTLDLDLDDGEHNLSVESLSKSGTSSGKTDNFKLIVDGNLLPPIEIEEIVANNGPEEIPLKSGDATNDTTPVLRGSGNDGDIVYIYDNAEDKDNPIGTAIVEGGKWEFVMPEMEEGQHELVVKVEDPATGKISEGSEPVMIVIDITPPDQPGKPVIEDNVGDGTGIVEPGKPTDDDKPVFTGEGGEPGDTVEVIIRDEDGNEKVIGTGIVGEDGDWKVEPTDPIDDGEYEAIVVITDPAGNKSDPSDPVDLIIDTKVPDLSDYEFDLWDDVGPYTDIIKSGDVTDDTQPTLVGKGIDGSEVIIYDGEKEIGRVVVADGKWEFEVPVLPEGDHNIRIQPVSESGVRGATTEGISFVVDTTAPTTGTFDAVKTDKTGVERDASPFENDNTLIMRGTGTNGDLAIIYGDAARTLIIGSAVVEGGEWKIETEVLIDADYEFNAGFRDAAGNEYNPDTGFKIKIDTEAPPPPEIDLFSAMNLSEGLMNMSLNEILSQGNDSLLIDNGKTQMIVSEKAGEELKLEDVLPKGEDLNNWTQANGTVTVAGVEYNVYQNNGGDAEVMVPQHLMQEQQH
jgi:hypothetical protein